MASPMKNLTGDIMTRLKADSDVIALLANGADSIFHWLSEQTEDLAGMPKPYIDIVPTERDDGVEFANRREMVMSIDVEYVINDSGHKSEPDFYDEEETVDIVLRNENLINPTYGADKAFRTALPNSYVKEDGLRKIVFKYDYTYKQNK